MLAGATSTLSSSPLGYEALHHLIGARRWLERFADDVICARGFDRNEAYIERAKRAHGNRGKFICSSAFNQPKATSQNGHFPFPHSICIMEATRAAV